MTKKWIWVLAVLLIASGAGYWGYSHKGNAKSTPEFEHIFPSYQTIMNSVEAPGSVVPKNRVGIIPPINGRIEDILVEEGERVKKGQVLALMSSSDRAALLDAARSEDPKKLAYWESVYKPTKLFAPLNGQIIVRSVELGQMVNTSTEVFVISDELIVRIQVDETDIGKIKPGQEVEVVLDAYRDTPVSGKIGLISYESTVVNNVVVYEVDVILSRIPNFFRSGMSADATVIQSKKEQVLTIPEYALHNQNGKTFVFVKDTSESGKHRQEITVGMTGNGVVEITDGLTEKDEVLVEKTGTTRAKTTQTSGLIPTPSGRRR